MNAVEQRRRTLGERYELGDVVGRGAMGEVWAARDLRLDRPVAVKVLTAPIAADVAMRARFRTEAQAAARLSHPNVVTVYDSGEDDGLLFLVMELLPGRTLADEIADGPLDAARARAVGVDVLAGLAASHRAGILHRDIKPANVLLAADGTARVADFGIAKSLEGGDATSAGLVLGTAAYLAPERLAGQPATPQSDLYAVGAVLYEALAGRKPFDADTPLGMLRAIEDHPPPALHGLQPSLDRALVATVERALAKAPQDRFATATEMADALGARNSSPYQPADTESTVAMTLPASVVAPRSPSAPSSPTEALSVAGPDATAVAPVIGSSTSANRLHPTGTRPWWRRPSAIVAGLVVGVLAVLAGVLLAPGGGQSSGAPPGGSDPAATSTSLPEALDAAIRQLEEVVRS